MKSQEDLQETLDECIDFWVRYSTGIKSEMSAEDYEVLIRFAVIEAAKQALYWASSQVDELTRDDSGFLDSPVRVRILEGAAALKRNIPISVTAAAQTPDPEVPA